MTEIGIAESIPVSPLTTEKKMAYGMETPAEPIQSNLNSVLRDMESEIQRLAKVVGHLTIIGDRLEGSRPQEAANPKVDHPPHCLIDDARRKRDGLQMLCSQLESAAQRIDRAVGDAGIAGAQRIA